MSVFLGIIFSIIIGIFLGEITVRYNRKKRQQEQLPKISSKTYRFDENGEKHLITQKDIHK